MTKKQWIDLQILQMTGTWYSVTLILGSVLFLMLSFLDYLVAPRLFNKFLVLRVSIAVVLMVLFYLVQILKKTGREKKYLFPLIIAGLTLSAATIEIMVLNLGGHRSFYYAGFILLTICALGLMPLSLGFSSFCASLIYLIYLIPILLFDRLTNYPLFISNNFFIISTFVIALAWRYLSQKNLIQLLSLQFDQKKHQEILEELVDKRTKRLQESEKRLAALFEQANDGIIILNDKGVIVDVNKRACELHGFDRNSLIGFHGNLLDTGDHATSFNERLQTLLSGKSLLYETSHYRKDGTKIPLEMSERAIEINGKFYIQSFQRDIEEKKKLLRQLLHSQKMESIGQLAGGLAHNFKNLLTAITANADAISYNKENLDQKTLEALQGISNAGRQGTAIVGQLLSFSSKNETETRPLRANEVIEATKDMITQLIPKNISIKLMLKEHLPLFRGNVYNIEQLLINLMVNARDAMPQGGEIAISTAVIEIDSVTLGVEFEVKKGKYIHIKISDTGLGIPDESLDKIFEPFFTTKGEGTGTGLGLAMVYGTVKENGGYVMASNNATAGASFDLYFPAIPDSPEEEIGTPLLSDELRRKFFI